MREVTPPKRDSGSDRDERTHAWITRAKALYNQDKKLVVSIPTNIMLKAQ